MIKVQIEKFADFMEEFDQLCKQHWHEVARNREIIPLSPDYNQYLKLDEMGMLCCSTARDKGKLIGYCINIITPHMHYSKTIFALNDLLFVTRSKRGFFVGTELLKKAIDEMKKRNVKVFHMHAKIAHDIKPIMKRLDFIGIETIYEKVL